MWKNFQNNFSMFFLQRGRVTVSNSSSWVTGGSTIEASVKERNGYVDLTNTDEDKEAMLCKTPNRVMEEELQNETKTETDTGTLKGITEYGWQKFQVLTLSYTVHLTRFFLIHDV